MKFNSKKLLRLIYLFTILSISLILITQTSHNKSKFKNKARNKHKALNKSLLLNKSNLRIKSKNKNKQIFHSGTYMLQNESTQVRV